MTLEKARSIAKDIYEQQEKINSEALYVGQVEQSGEAVEEEFIRLVSELIVGHFLNDKPL
jgi:hypothetical protein